MKDLPHRYMASARSVASAENVSLESPGLTGFESAGPAEFDGPGTLWSPETLVPVAVADCFILSFRAVAAASRFEWLEIACEVTGVLDKADRAMRFTEFQLRATLQVAAAVDEARALRVLEKAERVCLISNSLIADVHATFEVVRR